MNESHVSILLQPTSDLLGPKVGQPTARGNTHGIVHTLIFRHPLAQGQGQVQGRMAISLHDQWVVLPSMQ